MENKEYLKEQIQNAENLIEIGKVGTAVFGGVLLLHLSIVGILKLFCNRKAQSWYLERGGGKKTWGADKNTTTGKVPNCDPDKEPEQTADVIAGAEYCPSSN